LSPVDLPTPLAPKVGYSSSELSFYFFFFHLVDVIGMFLLTTGFGGAFLESGFTTLTTGFGFSSY
jgi:hypothetical protein